MAVHEQWELEQRLVTLLGLDESEAKQSISYASTLREADAREHFRNLLGDSQEASQFITAFEKSNMQTNGDSNVASSNGNGAAASDAAMQQFINMDSKAAAANGGSSDMPPSYAAPPGQPPKSSQRRPPARPFHQNNHSNAVIEAARYRAHDEQRMQQMLQDLQYRYDIYNSDIEPEHDTDYYCSCPIHQYKAAKYNRYPIQRKWSEAVMYPGEKAYDDNQYRPGGMILTSNPYRFGVVSPFGYFQQNSFGWQGPPRPQPSAYTRFIHQTIDLNNSLNKKAQANIDAKEPAHNVWAEDAVQDAMSKLSISDSKRQSIAMPEKSEKFNDSKGARMSIGGASQIESKSSGFSKFRKAIGIKSSDERAISNVGKKVTKGNYIRDQILEEESGRWPDDMWRTIVENYQAKVGMTAKISELRAKSPIQYLHLLRAGFFEPIPVDWADQASNPLKFSIDAAAGWRGVTPAWRGYEDTAEERLYWVLNHRINPEGATLTRLKPDFISEMNMARTRMASAVEPPPAYFDNQDTCHIQHTSEGYSKQVMPPAFRAYDRPETASDDTMILLDVSGSMDFQPVRPLYDQYLITKYERGTQPKNKDVAKAIVRRFTDAMLHHDHQTAGYDLVTFANHATHIGSVTHKNLDQQWSKVRLGGGTRVMTGWQKVKQLHFQKHSESATYHPVYGWQAGPETPMLRLLLLLDGEATDMDEFELDLLGLSWAHVTIFLIGVDGCPHHHRHANELQRISDVNHHVNFVDAQGNCPERFVTHELLKRHLGYDITMQEFQEMEELPAYEA